jgi:AraC-like DNA-binding protein
MTAESRHDVISFVAHQAANVSIHYHQCFQIVASIEGDFTCTIGGQTYEGQRGFMVNQLVPHSCQAPAASVIVFFIDAESQHGWQLKALLAERPMLDLQEFFPPTQWQRLCAPGNARLPKTALRQLADELWATILPPPVVRPAMDARMPLALDFITAHLSESLRLEEMAALLHLSPGRARHLFAQETGSPFSQYVLWKRIKQVIVTVVGGDLTLTEAALQCGFADQAHFCRVFKRMFGMSPKTHLKNSPFVQFLNPFI